MSLESATDSEYASLKLSSIIGFAGQVPNGYFTLPDGKQIYTIGSNICIKNTDGSVNFLQGHTDLITSLALSSDGSRLASGQKTYMGFQADIIIWDLKTQSLLSRLSLHKVQIASLSFSLDGKYLVSLGGQDDNNVILWDMDTFTALCGHPASPDSSGSTLTVKFHANGFVTGGMNTLRSWFIDRQRRKLIPSECKLGQIKRVVGCLAINGESVYCGTSTGDVLKVDLATGLFKIHGPKTLLGNGVRVVEIDSSGQLFVGAGDGTIATMTPDLKIKSKFVCDGSVTSISFSGEKVKVGTSKSNIYDITANSDKLDGEIISTCHYGTITDIQFPESSSQVFVTAGGSDIRIWNASSLSQLLVISIPNLTCTSVVFKKDGSSIITGWSDGKIRAFGPQSGREQYTITDAHTPSVTALAVMDSYNSQGDFHIVSGGGDGQVRVWDVTKHCQRLIHAMKEHKGTVSCIKIKKNGLECVSTSFDGSAIIWDMTRYARNQVVFAPSFFNACCYCPDESQLLTAGTDRKVAYWEVFDGSVIRELEASQSDTINGLDITPSGKYFCIGGSDKILKVYRYEEGDLAYCGFGHSTDITKVRISPDGKKVISVGASGAIFQWDLPVN